MIATILSWGVKFWFDNWKWLLIALAVMFAVSFLNALDNKRLLASYNLGKTDCEALHKALAVQAAEAAQIEFNNAVKLREEANNEATKLSRIARDSVMRDSNDRYERLRNAAIASANSSTKTAVVGGSSSAETDRRTDTTPSRGNNDNNRTDDASRITKLTKQVDGLLRSAFDMRTVALECAADVKIAHDQLEKVENAQASR